VVGRPRRAPTATSFAIEEAFRRLASKYHPDREGGSTEMMQSCTARVVALKERS
jgi:curved DNA-binding protein CbpA